MSNVDTAELDKFASLASAWWDRNGEFKSLHDINPLRVEFVAQQVDGLFGKKVLDVGCGGGILSEALAQQGASVTGIDMVQESLDVANLHRLESGIKVDYELTTAEDWALQHEGEYDCVCCLEMLEHVPDPSSIVNACAKLVKPGGTLVFSTLNRNIKSYLLGIVAAEYVFSMVPKGTHEHAKFIKPSELVAMVEQSNLVAKVITGMHFNPLKQQYYLSNANVDVNYFLVCERSA